MNERLYQVTKVEQAKVDDVDEMVTLRSCDDWNRTIIWYATIGTYRVGDVLTLTMYLVDSVNHD